MSDTSDTSEPVPMRPARFPDVRPFFTIKADTLKAIEALVIGRLVIQAGKRCMAETTRLFVVVEGVVEVLAPNTGATFYCVARIETGDLEDLACFADVPGMELSAPCGATLFFFDREDFYRTACMNPEAAWWVMRSLGTGRSREQRNTYSAAALGVEEAVMADLRRIAVRRDLASDQGMMAARATQEEVAQRLMRRRETVSRVMAKLVREGRLIRQQQSLYLIPSV